MADLEEMRRRFSEVHPLTCAAESSYGDFEIDGYKVKYNITGDDAYIETKHGVFPSHFHGNESCQGSISGWARTNIDMIERLYRAPNVPKALEIVLEKYTWCSKSQYTDYHGGDM
jgi:hypothetical protein